MYQDSHFSPDPAEEVSDIPQLPFPEPIGADTLQHPFPAHVQPTNVPSSPQLSFPASLPLAATPSSPQQPISTPPATQYDYTQNFFSQPLPSTETIDITQIAFLRQVPPAEIDFAHQDPQPHFPHQLTHASTPLSSFQETGIQSSFTTQMPAFVEVPIITQGLPVTRPDTAPTQSKLAPSNQQAKRAIINGVISLVVSTFTFFTIAGFAGLVIGTFAIIYGIMGVRLAWRLPNKAGWGQALIGIALGLLAWCIVIAASIFRAPLSS
jgi:hypothetical protein